MCLDVIICVVCVNVICILQNTLNLGITPGSERTSQNLSLWNDTLESSAETRRLTLHIEDISTWR